MFGRPSVDEYERQQAERAERERQAAEYEAERRARFERRQAEMQATRERKLDDRVTALEGMSPHHHLERATRAYAVGDTNVATVELLFAIVKGGGRP